MVKTKKISNSGQIHRFYVPFKAEEALNDGSGKCMTISGCAISETTTLNGHKFLAEELEPAAESLSNKPLLKDHSNMVDDIVGRTTKCAYDPIHKCILFNAVVKDQSMCDKIKQGLINSVSVGATIREAECEECDDGSQNFIMRGINFVELSLVAVPADPNAGFACSVSESFQKEITEVKVKVDETKNVEEQKLMSEISEKIAALAKAKEELELEVAQLAVEKLTLAKEKAIAEKVAVQEASKVQEAVAMPTQTKGQVATETVEETKTETKIPFVASEQFGSLGIELDYSQSKVLSRGN